MGEIVMVTGGARSGKSAYAERLLASAEAVTYLATMPRNPSDGELAIRIATHQQRRPGTWRTLEEPLDLVGALGRIDDDHAVLLDCLTLWVSNMLFRDVPAANEASAEDWSRAIDGCLSAANGLCDIQARRRGQLIAVTNEVGMGIVPGDALSRAFRDATGLVNQCVAARAGRVALMISGRALDLQA